MTTIITPVRLPNGEVGVLIRQRRPHGPAGATITAFVCLKETSR